MPGRPHWAPNDVMLNYFERLLEDPTAEDARYVLALLLVRRRMLRVEGTRAAMPPAASNWCSIAGATSASTRGRSDAPRRAGRSDSAAIGRAIADARRRVEGVSSQSLSVRMPT